MLYRLHFFNKFKKLNICYVRKIYPFFVKTRNFPRVNNIDVLQRTYVNKSFMSKTLRFSSPKYRLVGPKPFKHTHLKVNGLVNWKFFRINGEDNFKFLLDSNLVIQKTWPSIPRYKHHKFNKFKLYTFKNFNTKSSVRNPQSSKQLFATKQLLISKKYSLFLNSPQKHISLRGVNKDYSDVRFRGQQTHYKVLNFTNRANFFYKNSINLIDNFMSNHQSFFKYQQISKSYIRFTKPRQDYSVYRKFRQEHLKHNPQISYALKFSKRRLRNTIYTFSLESNSNILNYSATKNFHTTYLNKTLSKTFSYKHCYTYVNPYDPTTVQYKGLLSVVSNLDNMYYLRNSNYARGETSLFLKNTFKLNFVFTNLSMFLVTIHNLKVNRVDVNKYIWRKKIYSFIQPNEYRNNLFFKKKKLFFNTLVRNQNYFYSNFSNSRNLLSLPQLSPLYTTLLRSRLGTDFLNKNKTSDYFSMRNVNWFDYSLNMLEGEMRISRVRFKPGYQNIWRKVRGALKEYLGLKYIYQQQLTKYLSKFYISSNKYLWGCSELSIFRIFLYSRLLPDKSSFDLFWKEKSIYINGLLPSNKNMILSPGDTIQLIVSLNYYILHRWLLVMTKERTSKFRRLVYKKGLSRKYKIVKQRKQKSYYTPTWIYKNRFDFSDVKNFLEVDYFTLSAVVVYTPYLLSYHTYDNQIDLKINTFRLYNWKYIT